jgi:hypothetical protein
MKYEYKYKDGSYRIVTSAVMKDMVQSRGVEMRTVETRLHKAGNAAVRVGEISVRCAPKKSLFGGKKKK